MIGTSVSDGYVLKENFAADLYQYDLVREFVPRDGTVIDIGAHKGFFSCMAGRHYPRVLSFEASERNYKFLKENAAINELHGVEPKFIAVYKEDGEVTFHQSGATDARNSINPSEFAGKTKVVTVPCLSLDSVFTRFGVDVCSLMKVDCEGAELDILRAASKETLDRVHVFLLELHEDFDSFGRVTETLDVLASQGFETFITSDKLMKKDLYTSMAVAVNTSLMSSSELEEFTGKLTYMTRYSGEDYESSQRNLFKARMQVVQALAQQDFPAELSTFLRGDLTQVIERLSFVAWNPEVLFCWGAHFSKAEYDLWKPYLEGLDLRAAVLGKAEPKGERPRGSVPTFLESGGVTTDFLAQMNTVRTVVLTRDDVRTDEILHGPGASSVLIQHDEMTRAGARHTKGFDKVFVNSSVGVERCRALGGLSDASGFETVGLPIEQGLKKRKAGEAKPLRNLLYAPPWEGPLTAGAATQMDAVASLLLELQEADPALSIRLLVHPPRHAGVPQAKVGAAMRRLKKALADVRPRPVSRLFNDSDVLITDSPTLAANYLPTGKPVIALSGAPVTAEPEAPIVHGYPLDPSTGSLRDLLAKIEASDELRPRRVKELKLRMGDVPNSFKGSLAAFERALTAATEQSRAPSVASDTVDRAKAILKDANCQLLSGPCSNGGGGSGRGTVWLRSPFGLGDPTGISGRTLLLTEVKEGASRGGVAIDPSLKTGDQLLVTSCEYVFGAGVYRLGVKNQRTGEAVTGTIPNHALQFTIDWQA